MPARKLDDWLKGYAEYTAQSDSPQVFHMWCALGTIAGAAQRKIYMPYAYYDVHTNMFIVLVSPPGRGKKSSAMRAAKAILKEVEPRVNFVSESGSFEGLIGSFAKITNPTHQSMTLYSSELGSLMSTNPVGMVDFLTDIYDGNPDWGRQTVKHDLQVIKKPWLNLISGTTPKWLSERLGLIALEGGLMARTILPYSEDLILENPRPKETPAFRAVKQALIHDLSIIATLNGTFDFDGGDDGETAQWYDSWYKDRTRYPAISDPRTASYYDRKHIHLLKVAMLLSLSHKDELVLDLPDLQRALKFLDATESGMRLALNAVGRNEQASEASTIMAQLRARGKISYQELLIENFSHMRFGKKGFDEALSALATMGKIRQDQGVITVVDASDNGKGH